LITSHGLHCRDLGQQVTGIPVVHLIAVTGGRRRPRYFPSRHSPSGPRSTWKHVQATKVVGRWHDTWNEGCFLTSASSFRLQTQLSHVLIRQGHREDTIMAVVLIPRKAKCLKKIKHPARWPAALFWRAGAAASQQRIQSCYIYRPPKPNVAIGQEDLAIRLYDAVCRRIRTPRCR
jgi:hypothetical protein